MGFKKNTALGYTREYVGLQKTLLQPNTVQPSCACWVSIDGVTLPPSDEFKILTTQWSTRHTLKTDG